MVDLPAEVRKGFGLDSTAEPTPLAGGDETTVLIDGIVVKKVIDPVVGTWTQQVLSTVEADEFRVPAPIMTADGGWVVDGWIASLHIDGLRSLADRPDRVIEVGSAFARIVTETVGIDHPPVRARCDRWARGDRFAWDEEDLPLSAAADEVAHRLRARTRTIEGDEAKAVIHGDLTGNVFLDPADQPVVLDFSPFLRPVNYGTAIVVADHLLWGEGTAALVGLVDGTLDGLARALLFRLASEQLADNPRHGARLADYWRVIELLGWA